MLQTTVEKLVLMIDFLYYAWIYFFLRPLHTIQVNLSITQSITHHTHWQLQVSKAVWKKNILSYMLYAYCICNIYCTHAMVYTAHIVKVMTMLLVTYFTTKFKKIYIKWNLYIWLVDSRRENCGEKMWNCLINCCYTIHETLNIW